MTWVPADHLKLPVRRGSTDRQERPWAIFDADDQVILDVGTKYPDLRHAVLFADWIVQKINAGS